MHIWARAQAARLLLAHRAAEGSRAAAVDCYARGAFADAALLFGRSLAILQVGGGWWGVGSG